MDTIQEFNVLASKKPKLQPKISPKMWKREEVLALLDVYEATLTHTSGLSNETEDELWIMVSEKLNEQGIEASPIHCQSKWNLLHKTFTVNPSIEGAFFVKVKQIQDKIASIKECTEEVMVEEEEVELYKEERLENETETEEFTIEDLKQERTFSFTAEPQYSVCQLIERLSSKVDTLVDMHYRQEARLEEVYQMQQTNQNHLLQIKKHLNIV